MLDYNDDPRVQDSWIPSSASINQEIETQARSECLDGVPVLSSTVLGLEMLLHEPFIDLRKISDLILSDVGATIRILRLIGREYGSSKEHPRRMDDCLSGLEVEAWFEDLYTHVFTSDSDSSKVTALWRHCRSVAEYSHLIAESIQSVSAEDAYLVGLLHEVGSIPGILGRRDDDVNCTSTLALVEIEGSLPLFVLAALRSANDGRGLNEWGMILTAAHQFEHDASNGESPQVDDIDSDGIDSRWKQFLPAVGPPVLSAVDRS